MLKATGIVRRIDDLGRVVIPKEIRRTQLIRVGDPLEIFVSGEGEVIFKKYSPMGELSAFAATYVEILHKTAGITVVVADRDRVIAACGPYKDLLERRVSADYEALVDLRRMHVAQDETTAICSGHDAGAAVVAPVLCHSDLIGSVALLDDNLEESAARSALVQVAAAVLGKQMEE